MICRLRLNLRLPNRVRLAMFVGPNGLRLIHGAPPDPVGANVIVFPVLPRRTPCQVLRMPLPANDNLARAR